MTTTLTRTETEGGPDRFSEITRPRPRTATIVSYAVIIGTALLGIWSFIGLNYTFKSLDTTIGNINRFLGMATPVQWPGSEVIATRHPDGSTTYVTEWVGVEPILETLGSIAITLALVIAGTALAALLSIPVAYGAAHNTTPARWVLMFCRGIGVTLRAIPDVVFVVFLAFLWFNSGTLPAIVAIGVHSVGMISKMFADAIEQIDEGPRLAIRATGGTKSQEFWSGIVPQVLPAWIAVTLHRADINLRSTVILGVVGVAGLGYDLDHALHGGPAGMRRVIPIVIIIIVLCMVFEVISSLVRAKLLGVRPSGKSTGDTAIRALANRSSSFAASLDRHDPTLDQRQRIEASLHRPWTKARLNTTLWIWVAVLIVLGSFIYADPDLSKLFSAWRWDLLVDPEMGRAVFPPTFGGKALSVVLAAVVTTLQVAFAATLMGAVLSTVVGPLSASNVAPNSTVRNFFRGLTLFIRAVPDLVVAILFIIATGFGPQAAALALGIGGVGLLAKLIGDSVEEVSNGPLQALHAAGATRTQVFFASTLPMSIPAIVSHLMYLLEQNVRSATLLGIVGGGGIGFLLLNAMQGRHFDQVLAYVLVIIAMVVVVETASILIRKALK